MNNVPEVRGERVPRKYSKGMGSGWFWCHHVKDWIVCYINMDWGARLDGHYVRTENFDDVVGPLEAPDELK